MGSRDFAARLARRSSRAGLFLHDELVEQLSTFYTLLSRWNQKINLTSLTDPDEAIDRLLLEPIAAARYLSGSPSKLMDVGSGGGSPAIPLKLALPRLALTMVEVKARKSAFLRESVRSLGLSETSVETARVEELLTRADLHESFDAVSLRAVRVESKVLNTIQAFVKSGGKVLLFRGPTGPSEPSPIVPPLEFSDTYPLIETLQSRLTVLTKRAVGPALPPPAAGRRSHDSVPRGTLR